MAATLLKMSQQMKNMVDFIVNENYDSSPLYLPNFKIGDRQKAGHYDITCKFYGTDIVSNEPFELIPYQIKLFNVEQSFVTKYADEVTLKIALTPVQYMNLFDNARELKVLIQMFPYSVNDSAIPWFDKKTYEPIFSKEYYAVFKNKEDIRKSIPKEQMLPKSQAMFDSSKANQYMETEFTLIESLPYIVRKKSVNFQLRDATVQDIILQGCKLFGIKKISFVPPDNKQVYQNIIIPPILSFEEFFRYVNDYFGVYNQGYNFYITDNILYIYPTYNAEIKSPRVTHFYNAGKNSYEGTNVLHAKDEDENYHVVINTDVVLKNLQDDVPENMGTHYVCLDADQQIDNLSIMKEAEGVQNSRIGLGKLSITKLSTYSLSSGKDDIGSRYNTFTPMYIFDWNNKFAQRSILAAMRGTMVTFKWNNSVPYIFTPGYRVQYHYDSEIPERSVDDFFADNYMYATKVGNCYQCNYRVTAAQREGSKVVYNCTTDVTLFLAPEKMEHKQEVETVPSDAGDNGILRSVTSAASSIFGDIGSSAAALTGSSSLSSNISSWLSGAFRNVKAVTSTVSSVTNSGIFDNLINGAKTVSSAVTTVAKNSLFGGIFSDDKLNTAKVIKSSIFGSLFSSEESSTPTNTKKSIFSSLFD